ncbi:hypothetical protein MMC25_000692 [Agyrium rufum]|nr:hypothetical protein [Agyrium rufum]
MATTSNSIDPAYRKKVVRVIVISLLLDLISFTFILPLYPNLLEFYRSLETTNNSSTHPTLLSHILELLNTYKRSFSRPISSRYDIVLLGGALGSLYSLLQAIASPIIGRFSDKYGRRTALLWSMAGNIASVALWVAATDFRTFLASRVVAGLSEGNVQLATAMAADISDEKNRGATMALVGICFSIAFTFGPALGAALASTSYVAANPFATAASFSLFLIVVETVYLYLYLPETRPTAAAPSGSSQGVNGSVNEKEKKKTNGHANTSAQRSPATESSSSSSSERMRTNSHTLLNSTHFLFIFFFSGLEFSLPFMTYDLFAYSSASSGKLLGFMGIIASILQGSITRRLHPLRVVQLGVFTCTISFFLLAKLTSERMLYAAAALLAVTTGTVVTGLNSLSSFEAGEGKTGEKLGEHRGWGQVGRAMGPVAFCSLYWWAGREVAYQVGGAGMVLVLGIVLGGLKKPARTIGLAARDEEKKKRI